MNKAFARRTIPIVLVVVLGLGALVLRAWGAAWSLPYADHPDEPAVINVVLRIVEGQLDPNSFFYPSLMFYLQALNFKLHFWWGLRTGLYSAPLQLPPTTDFYTTVPGVFVWGRVLTAMFGAATVAVVATRGSRLLGHGAALLAAALLVTSSWAVVHSHYVTVDVPAALFATLSILAALAIVRSGTWRDYLLAGLCTGVAGGTKYQAVLVAVAVVVAHVLRWRRQSHTKFGRLVVAGLVATAAFLVTSPYVVLNFAAFQRDIRTLMASYDGSHGDVTGAWPVWAYIRFLWREGLGPIPALLAVAGIVDGLRRRPAQTLVLLAFPVALLVVSLQARTHFFRNLLPLQPALLLLSGLGAVALWELVQRFMPSRIRAAVAALCALVLVAPRLLATYEQSASFARPDSRVAAQEALREQWPGVRTASELTHPLRWNGVALSTHIHYLPLYSPDWYRHQGYGLLVASSNARRTYAWPPDYQPFLSKPPVLSYGGPNSPYRGPQIDVLETGLSMSTLPADGPRARIGPIELLGALVGHLVEHDTGPEVVETRTFKPSDIAAVTTFWTTPDPAPAVDYMLFMHLRSAEGVNVAQRDAPPWLGLFPPSSWKPGSLVAERLDLALPAGLPPGEYRLVLGLYDAARATRFPASTPAGSLPGDEVDLGSVTVEP